LPPIPVPHPGPAAVVFTAPGGPGNSPRVALTIDDGYDAETVAGYVAFAERTRLPITFSPNGAYRRIWEAHARQLRPLIQAGQVQIGNHTYTHLNLLTRTNGQIRDDVERNEEWIQRTFGITSRPWFRPPFGKHNARTDALLGELGFTKILMWEGSFGDSRLLTPEVLLGEARKWLTGGRIVLGHANHPTVTHLFDQLLALIHQRGLELVTLDAMFGTSRAHG
jgi:peptidoglycan/xylan/chitin deacetylase (PgdA/CDA1 family)